jgi:hypothetical protein
MRFISKSGKVYWKNPEKQKLWREKTKARTVKVTDVQAAVAKEMIILGDSSMKSINAATKSYLKQLRKDGFLINHKLTKNSNARKVNYIISQL